MRYPDEALPKGLYIIILSLIFKTESLNQFYLFEEWNLNFWVQIKAGWVKNLKFEASHSKTPFVDNLFDFSCWVKLQGRSAFEGKDSVDQLGKIGKMRHEVAEPDLRSVKKTHLHLFLRLKSSE